MPVRALGRWREVDSGRTRLQPAAWSPPRGRAPEVWWWPPGSKAPCRRLNRGRPSETRHRLNPY